MLTWNFTLETFARVAAWAVIVGFFWTLGCALAGWRPQRSTKP